jgi:hypothetical protein
LRSRFQPGLALAAGVLLAALLALALMDGGPGGGSTPPPAPGDGATVRLLPPGRGDAGIAQYGAIRHGGGTLQGARRGDAARP